ncbi:MAG: CoA transferase [Phenylobacterium zucineum]|nr:MAG: CoA transferase [Phenylobacterium zucineum]
MTLAEAALARLSEEIAERSSVLGRRVDVAAMRVTDRAGELPLAPAGGLVSPNGACRLFRAADGWMALNLARPEDADLVPAWLECDLGEPWALVTTHAPRRTCADLAARADLLGLPACRVGEAAPAAAPRLAVTGAAQRSTRTGLKVVDLSALWAGPLCGAVLAAMGAEVVRVESVRRPDPSRRSTPGLFARLNGAKSERPLDLADPAGHARLLDLIRAADVVITSARRRGLASIGLDPLALVRAVPGLVWVAISGYGQVGPDRPAFGDDAAAAGGLLRWADGEPCFLGDALADPVTGLAAAASALAALQAGGGVVVDAGMAPAAARAVGTALASAA